MELYFTSTTYTVYDCDHFNVLTRFMDQSVMNLGNSFVNLYKDYVTMLLSDL